MMFLLLPGAGGMGFLWSRVAPLLEAAGHRAIAVDLPGADPKAGLDDYAALALRAVAADEEVVLVAASMGAFTAALVANRRPLAGIVFVNAMIPTPGETASEWWKHVDSEKARVAAAKAGGYSTKMDNETYFLHDLTPELAREVAEKDGDEAPVAFEMRCAFEGWPSVPMHLLAGEGDRLFPPDFQERVARERLGAALTSVTRIPGGHLAPLAFPEPVASRLLALFG